jgi:hypothetical protein
MRPRQRSRASAEYAPQTIHPRKKPPWQLAQNRARGGNSQNQRSSSKMAMKTAVKR